MKLSFITTELTGGPPHFKGKPSPLEVYTAKVRYCLIIVTYDAIICVDKGVLLLYNVPLFALKFAMKGRGVVNS